MLQDNGIYLEVKRGAKKPRGFKPVYSVKNDVLAQIILSMVNQIPGTARNGSKNIFESPRLYNSVFRVNYEKDADKQNERHAQGNAVLLAAELDAPQGNACGNDEGIQHDNMANARGVCQKIKKPIHLRNL